MTADAPPLSAAVRQALTRIEALIAAGRLKEAALALHEARAQAPAHPEVPHLTALALARSGQPMPALAQHLQAYRLAPQGPVYRTALAVAFRGAQFTSASPAVVEALIDLLETGDVGAQELVPPALSLLHQRPALAGLLAAAESGDAALEAALSDEAAAALLDEPLWCALLSAAVVPDPRIETLLTALRRLALLRRTALGPGRLATLALQALATRWAWSEGPEETVAVEALERELRLAPAAWDERRLLLALYRPAIEPAPAPPQGPAALRRLHERLHEEPARLAELAAAIPPLTPLVGEASRRVAAQYEANPYPRWRSVTRQQPRPLAEVLREVLPALPAEALPAGERPRVLVAGCGTGQHAVKAGTRYAGAEVTAIDLSMSALAYAKLRADALGLPIRFAQADILALPGDLGPFAVIECSGVLHHLADPAAGLARLVPLLAPGGFLKLGLYSRLGRARVAAARSVLARLRLPPTPAGLRTARTQLRRLPKEHPAAAACEWLDFYDLDGLRDLLFPAQETSYDIPGVARLLSGAGLEFLGFELADREILDGFRARNPRPDMLRDLDLWHLYEQLKPETFASMYQFWCRPRPA